MKAGLMFRTVMLLCLVVAVTLNATAQWRLKTLSWNIQSGDSDTAVITEFLSNLEGYDVVGLSEVLPSQVDLLVRAIATGEGAKGNFQANFSHVLSDSGEDIRLLIVWDHDRFEAVDEPVEIHELNSPWRGHRSPFYQVLRNRRTNESFVFMVNHLARGDEELRNEQAAGLSEWVANQDLPVIAVGDYNFDYDIDEGIGNAAYDRMAESGFWTWLRPDRLLKSQSSSSYNSVLDFVWVAHIPEYWKSDTQILVTHLPFVDDGTTSDHRPIDATFWIYPEPEEEEPEEEEE